MHRLIIDVICCNTKSVSLVFLAGISTVFCLNKSHKLRTK